MSSKINFMIHDRINDRKRESCTSTPHSSTDPKLKNDQTLSDEGDSDRQRRIHESRRSQLDPNWYWSASGRDRTSCTETSAADSGVVHDCRWRRTGERTLLTDHHRVAEIDRVGTQEDRPER